MRDRSCAQFISDPSKFLSASLVSLSAMMTLELPHINVLSKVDILKRCAHYHPCPTGVLLRVVAPHPHRMWPSEGCKLQLLSQLPKRDRAKVMDRFLDMDVATLMGTVKTGNAKHAALTMAIGGLLQDFNMVR